MPDPRIDAYRAIVELAERWAREWGLAVDSVQFSYKGKVVLCLPIVPGMWSGPAADTGQGPSPVIKDILTILREAGKPLTRTMILFEMSERKMPWGQAAVERHLEALVADGTLEHLTEGRPRGYRLTESE